MIRPVLQDDAFLAEVAATRADGAGRQLEERIVGLAEAGTAAAAEMRATEKTYVEAADTLAAEGERADEKFLQRELKGGHAAVDVDEFVECSEEWV